jgi:hypothetical protein
VKTGPVLCTSRAPGQRAKEEAAGRSTSPAHPKIPRKSYVSNSEVDQNRIEVGATGQVKAQPAGFYYSITSLTTLTPLASGEELK